jgi:hypothetical protein
MSGDVWELYGLDPVALDDQTVWRAATKMVELFPESASFEAAQRADKALEQGDLDNFNLWQRITNATEDLERAKPSGGETIN